MERVKKKTLRVSESLIRAQDDTGQALYDLPSSQHPHLVPGGSLLSVRPLGAPWMCCGFLTPCLCSVVPVWNVLSPLACLTMLCSSFQTQLRSKVLGGNVTARGWSPLLAVPRPHMLPPFPGEPAFSVPAPLLWLLVGSNGRAGTFHLFPPPCLAWLQDVPSTW